MTKRNPIIVLLLTLVTVGIYGIYWMVKSNEELNAKFNDGWKPSTVFVVVFSLIFSYFYHAYWMIRNGARFGKTGPAAVLAILLPVFSMAYMQHLMNKEA